MVDNFQVDDNSVSKYHEGICAFTRMSIETYMVAAENLVQILEMLEIISVFVV